MKIEVTALADACLDATLRTGDQRELRHELRKHVQSAYELGLADGAAPKKTSGAKATVTAKEEAAPTPAPEAAPTTTDAAGPAPAAKKHK